MDPSTKPCPTCGILCTVERDEHGECYTPITIQWITTAREILGHLQMKLRGLSDRVPYTEKQLSHMIALLLKGRPADAAHRSPDSSEPNS